MYAENKNLKVPMSVKIKILSSYYVGLFRAISISVWYKIKS